MTNAHSLLGASGAHRWLHCPGSFRLSQTAPHRPSSIYAATGTLAHDYIETAVDEAIAAGLQPGERTIQETEIGKVWSQDQHSVTVDQDFVAGINVMLGYLRAQASLADWMKVEFRVELDGYFISAPPVSLFGTVDAGLLSLYNEELEIIDYKNGAGVSVTPIENPQLLFYAAGALAQLPKAQRDRVQTVTLTIVQPHAGGAPERSWQLSVVDLLMWVDEVLVPGVEACAQPDAPYVTGSWCRFCPVSHACPQLHKDAVAMAKQEFADIAGRIASDDMADALDIAERAELWIARVREFALDQLQHQVAIPGWSLVPTRPTRKWIYPDDDIAHRFERNGVSHADIWETRVRSPAQMEKVLRRTKDGRRLWEAATRMVEARSTGVKLGRSDRPDAKGEFDDDL
jgi:hypothetical protein